MRSDATRHIGTISRSALKIVAIVSFAFPILIMVTGSFRPNAEMFRYAGHLSLYSFVPASPTLDSYLRVLQQPLFAGQLFNTVLLGVVLATGTTMTSLLAAYAIARLPFAGRRILFAIIVATLFIPVDVILPPLFFVVRDLRLVDSFWGLALPFMFSPIGVYLLRQAILEVPIELDHATALDGAGPWETLRTAILPNVRSALLATWLMHFMIVWEWYLWPLIVMRRDRGQLAQVVIAGLLDPLHSSDYSLVFAAAVLAVIPAFLGFALLQRFLIPANATSGGK